MAQSGTKPLAASTCTTFNAPTAVVPLISSKTVATFALSASPVAEER